MERKRSASVTKINKSPSLDRRSKTSSSGSRKSSKKTSTDFTKAGEILPIEKINYGEEIVLLFYDSLLRGIVEEWRPITDEISVKNEDEEGAEVKVKDFKELTSEDLAKAQVVGVKGSQVSLSKRHTLSNLSLGGSPKPPSKEKFKKQSVDAAENTSISSRTKRRSSDKSERRRRGSLASSSTATLTAIKSEVAVPSRDSNAWLLKTQDENVVINFKNGNVYEGSIHRRAMHGTGKFWWADGAYYEGDFRDGDITGRGKMILSDLSYYEGEFCEGLFHGSGVFCITGSSMLYSGSWKGGKKHGRGWLLYGPNEWYDGEWFEDQRHGYGIRHYVTGAVYEGMWKNDRHHGEGSMVWENSDFYKGQWENGTLHGYGEYTWNAFFNKTFTFPILNSYRGSWADGTRNGVGLMNFGTDNGSRLAGIWKDNLKDGPGILVCGNGRQIESDPLFLNDKPIHLEPVPSVRNLKTSSPKERKSGQKRHSSLQMVATQLSSKRSSKKFDSVSSQTKQKVKDQCNPLDIPLHSVPEQVTFDFYILKVLGATAITECSVCESIVFENMGASSTYNAISSSVWNVVTMASNHSRVLKEEGPETIVSKASFPLTPADLSKLNYTEFSQYQSEKKQLDHCITMNLYELQQVYNRYATVGSTYALDYKPALVRMFLWQLWRDIGILDSDTSIHAIDLMLNENPDNGYETIHCPFEKIYFWQFLQALVAMSWHDFSKSGEVVSKIGGILGNCLRRFLEKYILDHKLHSRAYSLFEFRDLLPIHAVYRVYLELGEPHTARDFLKATCVRKGSEPPCYLKRATSSMQTCKISNNGYNAVPIGFDIMFMPEETERYEASEPVEHEDPFFNLLVTLRKLGIRKVVQCLAEVCPQVCQDGMVVWIDYPLSFLEFYEVLLLCAYKIVDAHQKEKDALVAQQQGEQPERVPSPPGEHVTLVTSEKKLKKNGKDKKKTKGK